MRSAFFALLALAPGVVAAQPPAQPPKPVVGAAVVEKEITTGQTFVGTVLPTRRATVGSAVSGRVVEFPIEVGQRVEEKQTLAQILTETISLELAAAEAELTLRREALRELENGSRPEEIEQAKAQLLSAQATNDYSQARLKRTEALYQRGGVTEETLDEVRSLAAASSQALKEAEATYRLVQAGPRKEKIAQAAAQVAMQEAVVERLKDQIRKHTVITRFPGYVVAEHTEAGAWVNQGDPVAEVVALDEVDVEAYVPENAIPYVRVGEEVRVEIPALPDRLVTGAVVSVNPQADVRARTFPVRVRVRNELVEDGPVIKAGMIARAVLPTGPVKRALLVPKDSLVLGGPRPMVYVAETDPKQPDKAVVRPVTVVPGVASGSLIEVEGDLRPGQTVVTLGNERLRPGDAVQVTRTADADVN
ncbi:MAG TPA: efflux RND transporter periplasmic adaptor subunit [Planctomycetaceae bacterium]